MSTMMHLFAATDRQGSECSTELGISEEEWLRLSEAEQTDIINEFKGNILDIWTQAIDEETNHE